ncbi:MAG: RsmB/NOP family class I SAM-dependent RNA methyltransferase [Methanomicrobia archaeon]|nr:RsmB/NOP family class I SAM-dependent RNA methyltransferase [Methanomicrobia archaeon]
MEEARTGEYKKEFLDRYRILFKDFNSFLKANERENLCIRVNTLKISKEKLRKRLEDRGVILEEIEYGFKILKSAFSISSCPEHLFGYFYIQGEAEMNIVPFFKFKEKLVIDMCASPGGKTTQISEIMKNKGVVLAFDVDRIEALKNNIQRLGVENCVVFKKDSTKLDIEAKNILLDAPCTGSGVIRKDPTRKYSRSMNDIYFCQNLQKKLLEAGIRSLKKDGELIYCTCSLEPEENEHVIDWALKNFDITLEEITTTINGKKLVDGFQKPFGKRLDGEVKKCKRFLPHVHDTHGMFVAKVVK